MQMKFAFLQQPPYLMYLQLVEGVTMAVWSLPIINNETRSDSTPYMNGRATMRGVFKAYVVFLYLILPGLQWYDTSR